MRIKILILMLLVQHLSTYGQSPAIATIPNSEDFGQIFNAGSFPLGNNKYITQQGDIGSFQTSQEVAGTFSGSLSDVFVAGIVSFDGSNLQPSSKGEGPYCYINNGNAALLISLSDKINAIYFSADASGLSNIKLSFKAVFTEKNITLADGSFFVQYFNGTVWEDIVGSTFSTNGMNVGDSENFNCLSLPLAADNQSELKFRILTFQTLAVDPLASEILSFAIDDIKITSQPLVPIVSNPQVSICGSGLAQFNISTISGVICNIYDFGSSFITSVGNNFKSPILNSSINYLFKTSDIVAGCESNALTVSAIVNSIPGVPVLNQTVQTFCGIGDISFSINSPIEQQYNWYSLSVGGTFISTGAVLNQTISSSSNFWVEATTQGCTSGRIRANAIVYTVPSAPILTVNLQTICGSGVFSYSVSGIQGNVYSWYNVSEDGAAFLTSNSYTSGTLSSQNEIVWVEAFNGFCNSATRTEAQSISYHIPTAPVLVSDVVSVCGSNAVTFNVSNPVEPIYNWYNVSVGGSLISTDNFFQTPEKYNTKDSVWVEANSGFCIGARTKAIAIYYPKPDVPILDQAVKSICGTNTLNFSVVNNTALGYNWFNSASGGTILGINSIYTTPTSYNIEVDTWVEAFDGICSSDRVISRALFKYVPATPVLDQTSKSICGSGTITFNITNNTEPQYQWYDSEVGGNLTFSGASFTTSQYYNTSLATWVEAYDGTCRSSRVKAEAFFNYVPVTPIVDQAVKSICGSGTISFSVTNNAEPQYRWFDAANGGTLLATNPNYSTPTYYNTIIGIWVEAYDGKCSSNRVSAEARFNYTPQTPILDNEIKSICGLSSISFSVTNNIEPQYRWYANETTDTVLSQTSNYTTSTFYNAVQSYWVDAFSGLCTSQRVKATAIYDSIPTKPLVINPLDSLCGDGTITFNALPKEGINFLWYNGQTGGDALANANTFTTPFLSDPNTYWVESNDGKCTSERVSVYAKIKDLPSSIITLDNNILSASENAIAYQWYIATPDNPIPNETTSKLTIRYSGAYFAKLTAIGGCEITGSYSYIKAGGDTIYYEGFQNGMPSGFTIRNYDNADVQAVGGYSTIYGNNAWVVIPATNKQQSTFFGGINNKVASATSLFNDAKIDANRWMITDTITLNHEGLSNENLINNTHFTVQWKAVSDDGGDYPDDYRVLISSTTTDTASFKQISYIKKESILPINRSVEISKDYNGKNIYLAFQLNTKRNRGNRLMIDDIIVIAKTDSIIIPPLAIEEGLIFNSLIAPNPAAENVKLRLNMASNAEVNYVLYDMLGNELVTENLGRLPFGEFETDINLAFVSNGMYILKIQAGNQSKILRLVVSK